MSSKELQFEDGLCAGRDNAYNTTLQEPPTLIIKQADTDHRKDLTQATAEFEPGVPF